MLQVYVYGEKENGFMDIDPNTKLQMEQLRDIYDTDFASNEYSLPADAPWTENNKRLFNFAERLQNDTAQLQSWTIDVISDGLPIFYNAKITLLEKNGLFTYRRGKFNFTISGSKGLFGTRIQNKYLTDLLLGGSIGWSDLDSRGFATSLMTGGYPQYDYIRFVPVSIQDFFDTDRTDSADEFLAKDLVNCTVINSAGTAWEFGRPTSADETVAATNGTPEYINYRSIPFFKAKYALRKIFEEQGYSVTGDFMTSTDFDDLLLYNNYAIENYAYDDYADTNRSINPKNHMPKILQSEFIKNLCSDFNMYPVFVDATTVDLRYRTNTIKQKKVADITDLISDTFISEITATTGTGVTITFSGSEVDSYFSDRVQDITGYTLAATVEKFSDLATTDFGRTLTTSDIAFVKADNTYYRVANAVSIPILWDAFSERLDDYKTLDGATTIDILIKPLAQFVEYDDGSALYIRRNYVGAKMKGSYSVVTKAVVLNECGLNIFYGKLYSVDSLLQPISFNHNRDKNNIAMVPHSLAIQGDDGLYEHFYKNWIDIKLRNELVKANISLNEKCLTLLAANEFVMAHNILFLQSKLLADYPISKNPVGELQMYIA